MCTVFLLFVHFKQKRVLLL